MVNQANRTENPPAALSNRPASREQSTNGRGRRAPANSKVRFFRTVFGVLAYAFAVLFLMSLIILRFHAQTMVIGALLLALIAMLVATYVPQWRR